MGRHLKAITVRDS